MSDENKGTLLHVAPSRILPTADNTRVLSDGDGRLEELRKSIEARGVLEPLLVRPHPKGDGRYELRAGMRRLAAAKLAGLETVPVIVQEMTDEVAREVTVLENLQREDLKPMEEAAAVRMLLNAGAKPEEIAEHIGKSTQWVLRRASLTRLSPRWQQHTQNPKHDLFTWPATWLEAVARLPQETQGRVFKRFFGEYPSPPGSLESLDRNLASFLKTLSKAPWKGGDATLLPKAGACNGCRKRASQRPELFEEHYTPRNDRCLDGGCWEKKLEAFVRRRVKELRKEHPDLLLLTYHYRGKTELGKLTQYYNLQSVKKNSPGARPGLVIDLDADDAGKLLWMAKRVKEGRQMSDEDKATRRAARRLGFVCTRLREDLSAMTYDLFTPSEKQALIRLAVLFGLQEPVMPSKKYWELAARCKRSKRALGAALLDGLRVRLGYEFMSPPLWAGANLQLRKKARYVADAFRLPFKQYEKEAKEKYKEPRAAKKKTAKAAKPKAKKK